MSDKQSFNYTQVEPPQLTAQNQTWRAAPAWWIVFTKELQQLWIGGKAPVLLFLFCVLQGVLTYLMVSNTSDPTPSKEMLYFTFVLLFLFPVPEFGLEVEGTSKLFLFSKHGTETS
ncbi:MAG: hypothetical protein ACREOO_20865 [bacterium]